MISGGNYFIRCLVDNSPLYIQPPKCSTKQGILKAGKRFYTDLMFTNENEELIRWMENLESQCQKRIFEHRADWFDGDMELHDVESYFTSPLKLFKSGKFYLARINISTVLGKPTLKIYNEDEEEQSFDSITDKMTVLTILEIQGIKCSARSFQIEIELKQMMVLKPVNLFDKCVFAPKHKLKEEREVREENILLLNDEDPNIMVIGESINLETLEPLEKDEKEKEEKEKEEKEKVEKEKEKEKVEKSDLEEISFDLDELPQTESIQIKQRNDVYYKMYREALKKAKIARDFALSSYLEAKHIKNTYMLDEITDLSDDELDSNLDFEE
jgi:hypothetical protein